MFVASLASDLSTLEHEQCQGLAGLVQNSPEQQIMVNFPAKQCAELKRLCWWGEVEETGDRFTTVIFSCIKIKHLV